ncbi:MAG TPA: substrate-binding domain-containing protein [Gemmatimonadaceae bacterium]|jgi:ribose transport system substrate-binding protein|nr:substrate-binding domain-containing protein [Gemmatimonadota bacterium]MBK8648155.1 substrate-binding domain-containing protein [Gemmatimonadota bacterium]HPV77482.1 substrate-binding domain-containing protein [Gemmatimonadaceae bacterium]
MSSLTSWITRASRPALAAASIALVACGGGGGGEAGAAKGDAPAGKTFTIAMIAKSSTNPVFLSGRQGAEAAAAELTKEHGVTVKIDWLTPPNEDGAVQSQRISEAVNSGANAILLSASDAAKVTGAVNEAVDRGVPVMTFDSDVPNSKRFSFYGGDDVKMGTQVMEELATQMGGKGKIAIIAGNQNAPNLQNRVKGVRETAAKYPGITIVDAFYHAETPQDAAAEVLRMKNAYPEVNGIVMIGGWALFTRTLLTDLDPKKIKIVSVDGLPAQLAYVESGLAPVLFAQPTYSWGYVSVKTIFDHVYLKKPAPAMVQMELVRVSKDNLGTWARQLKEWGFSDVDPKYLALEK